MANSPHPPETVAESHFPPVTQVCRELHLQLIQFYNAVHEFATN
jgi:hypothetical protein